MSVKHCTFSNMFCNTMCDDEVVNYYIVISFSFIEEEKKTYQTYTNRRLAE